jgi:excisionase family DNA binding protein
MIKKENTQNVIQKAALSTKEAAVYLSISLPTLFRITRAGELAHVRIGRVIRYRPKDLDDFLSARSTTKWEDFNKHRKWAKIEDIPF